MGGQFGKIVDCPRAYAHRNGVMPAQSLLEQEDEFVFGVKIWIDVDERFAANMIDGLESVEDSLAGDVEGNGIRHDQDGPRYVYLPTLSRDKARQSALTQLVQTFFDNSTEQAVAALLDMSKSKMSAEELERLSELKEKARKEGR